jgi:hypothetical protein
LLGADDRGTLRRQAWQTIAHLARRPLNTENFNPCPEYDADADWAEHKKIAAKLKIRWSKQEQTYVAK